MAKQTSETGTITRKKSKNKNITGQLKRKLDMLYSIHKNPLNSTITLYQNQMRFFSSLLLAEGTVKSATVDHWTKP